MLSGDNLTIKYRVILTPGDNVYQYLSNIIDYKCAQIIFPDNNTPNGLNRCY